jgi:glutamyl-Q tRNA(Asp) synthetase
MPFVTRFAPSPTGPLHLGHAYSALTISDAADAANGALLLRIEDTDSTRCRPEHDTAILTDLAWLGVRHDGAVRRQSQHAADYGATLRHLDRMGLLYPCGCSRGEIAAAGAQSGADGPVYPGTCRRRTMTDARPGDALRLDLFRTTDRIGRPRSFVDVGPLHPGRHAVDPVALLRDVGDPVLRRRLTGDAAYHLACPHDDAEQGVTHVIRGEDLWGATPLHVVLQQAMGWPTPAYHHHRLIRDHAGTRLAKVDRARAIAAYRAGGATPDDIRRMVGLPPAPPRLRRAPR